VGGALAGALLVLTAALLLSRARGRAREATDR
jgi:hypothetical protein